MNRWTAVLLLAAAAVGASANPPLYWKSVRLRATGSQSMKESRALSRTPGRSHSVMQFQEPLSVEGRRRLRLEGIHIVGFVPPNGYVVSGPGAERIAMLPAHTVYPIPAEAKVSPAIARSRSRDFVVVFHPDVPAALGRSILLENSIEIRDNPDLLSGQVLIRATREQVHRISKYDEVSYVFPASRELAQGTPTVACGGPITVEGPVGQYVALVGDGWDGKGQGSAQLKFAYLQLTQQLGADVIDSTFRKALAHWSNYVQVDFKESGDPYGNKTLAVLFTRGAHGDPFPFDGPGGVLGHTFYPAPVNPEPIAGDLHFDDDENWLSIDFFSVALHELGHALGLGHSDNPEAVMYPYYKRLSQLSQEDIDAIRQLYAYREPKPLDELDRSPEPDEPAPPAGPSRPDTPETPAIPLGPVVPPVPSAPADPPAPAAPDTPGTQPAPVPTPPASTPPVPVIPANPPEPAPPAAPVPVPPKPGPVPKPVTDTTAPSLTITFPFSTNVGTSSPTIALRGVARDDNGVVEVSWSTGDGQSGIAEGTSNWSIPAVKLLVGSNMIVIRARDAAGNTAWRSVMVTRF